MYKIKNKVINKAVETFTRQIKHWYTTCISFNQNKSGYSNIKAIICDKRRGETSKCLILKWPIIKVVVSFASLADELKSGLRVKTTIIVTIKQTNQTLLVWLVNLTLELINVFLCLSLS